MNWHPEKGEYFFSEMWTWSYTNTITEEPSLRNGEMSIYIDPPTGTILLTKNDTRYSGDMINWIIIEQDGSYVIGGADEFGEDLVIKTSVNDLDDYQYMLESYKGDFEEYLKPMKNQKTFGDNTYGWPTIDGQEYLMTYMKTNDQSTLHLAEVPFSARYFYIVESLVTDIQLPAKSSLGYILPENQLILSDAYQFNDQTVQYQLVSMSPAEYFISLPKSGE
jgi:hypothetical protein